jgi:hypothetical protein
MVRKFNYTNRRKVSRENITISIQRNGSKSTFNAVLEKSNLKFPETAKVYIEPYYGANYLRFGFGTVADLKQPDNTDITDLRQFSDKIYFRLKIVDESQENGLLLGFADKLPLVDDSDPSNKSSILFVNPVRMETNEIWKVNFESESEGMPVLEVNNSIEGIKELARSDARFIAFVYPAAIRLILQKIINDHNIVPDGDEWYAKWVRFTQQALGVDTPKLDSSDELFSNWVDDCVKSFCVQHKTLENYTKTL